MKAIIRASILCLGMSIGFALGTPAGAAPLSPSINGVEASDGTVSTVRWVCDRWGRCFWRPGPARPPRVVCRWRWRDTPWGPRRVRVCYRRW